MSDTNRHTCCFYFFFFKHTYICTIWWKRPWNFKIKSIWINDFYIFFHFKIFMSLSFSKLLQGLHLLNITQSEISLSFSMNEDDWMLLLSSQIREWSTACWSIKINITPTIKLSGWFLELSMIYLITNRSKCKKFNYLHENYHFNYVTLHKMVDYRFIFHHENSDTSFIDIIMYC